MANESFFQLGEGVFVLQRSALANRPLRLTELSHLDNGLARGFLLSTNGWQLQNGTDCVVLQVSAGPMHVGVVYSDNAQPAPAALVVATRVDQHPHQPIKPAFMAPAKGLSLIGHVAQMGDQMALPGCLLGDPDSQKSITGLQLVWPDKPSDIDVRYRLCFEKPMVLPWAECGVFSGLRQADARATGFEIEILDARAAKFLPEGVIYFSGGFQKPVVQGMNQGPSGLEHLAAVQLSIQSSFGPEVM